MRILIAGGGTGGHVFPALSIAEAITMVKPDAQIAFAGRVEGFEMRVFTDHGFRYYGMKTGQVKGMGVKAVSSVVKIAGGVLDGIRAIRDFGPDLVLGVGGYVSVPLCLAAVLLKKPFFLHEQNSIPGGANRLMGRFAELIFTGFEKARDFFPPRKTVYVGNPLRYSLVHLAISAKMVEGNIDTILVIGGSQGARALNDFAVSLVKHIRETRLPFRVVHQTGETDFERVKEMYVGYEDVVTAFSFDEDMAKWYVQVHFAVSRAGALTISELATFGIPAVLVPYPYAADGHQEENAREMERKGCYLLVEQEALTPQGVLDYFASLQSDREKYHECRVRARKHARPFAADEIARICIERVMGSEEIVQKEH